MGKAQLARHDVQAMLLYVARQMIASKDQLTQADKVIGDGDHGIGMTRGFENVLKQLEGQEFASVEQLFKTVGMAMMSAVGGAAGAIFGTLFRGAVKHLKGVDVVNAETFAQMLGDGLQAVKARGKAQPGDKTMVDALEPAAREAQNQLAAPLDVALVAITEAARQGMERTKAMRAAVGKAKTLGERSVGYPDPGALSTYLILKFMAEYTAEEARSASQS